MYLTGVCLNPKIHLVSMCFLKQGPALNWAHLIVYDNRATVAVSLSQRGRCKFRRIADFWHMYCFRKCEFGILVFKCELN